MDSKILCQDSWHKIAGTRLAATVAHVPWSTPMKITSLFAFAGLLTLTAHARAERPDCGLFPDMHSRLACYDNVSRAPAPDPRETVKPAAEKPKPATTTATARNRKPIRAY
jgi:hypothetical protein